MKLRGRWNWELKQWVYSVIDEAEIKLKKEKQRQEVLKEIDNNHKEMISSLKREKQKQPSFKCKKQK